MGFWHLCGVPYGGKSADLVVGDRSVIESLHHGLSRGGRDGFLCQGITAGSSPSIIRTFPSKRFLRQSRVLAVQIT